MPAKNIKSAQKNSALIITKMNDSSSYILYDPIVLVDLFKFAYQKTIATNPNITTKDAKYITSKVLENGDYLSENHNEYILATLHVKNTSDMPTVRYVAAKQGYGPLVYDIAMSHESSLKPDIENIAPEASQIWKYYFYHRDDVEKIKISNNKPQYLNSIFKLKNKLNTSTLEANHKKMLVWVTKNLPDFDVLNSSINFFERKYWD